MSTIDFKYVPIIQISETETTLICLFSIVKGILQLSQIPLIGKVFNFELQLCVVKRVLGWQSERNPPPQCHPCQYSILEHSIEDQKSSSDDKPYDNFREYQSGIVQILLIQIGNLELVPVGSSWFSNKHEENIIDSKCFVCVGWNIDQTGECCFCEITRTYLKIKLCLIWELDFKLRIGSQGNEEFTRTLDQWWVILFNIDERMIGECFQCTLQWVVTLRCDPCLISRILFHELFPIQIHWLIKELDLSVKNILTDILFKIGIGTPGTLITAQFRILLMNPWISLHHFLLAHLIL